MTVGRDHIRMIGISLAGFSFDDIDISNDRWTLNLNTSNAGENRRQNGLTW